ncbi:MAG: hypothetical protein JSV19_09300 [Phycisphaerales bacterium]|nr:MAG: hypothetical protein JSV19_09300 [Phycisphaerales bacterium]
MRRRSRTARVLKWAGLVFTVCVLVAWGVSMWQGFGYIYAGGDVTIDIAIYDGHLRITVAHLDTGHSVPPERSGSFLISSFYEIRDYQFSRLRAYARHGITCSIAHVPLLTAAVLLGLLTAMLWHRDRRPPMGHCQNCAYDLTGNVSGVCPECGNAIRGDGRGQRESSNQPN